MGAQFDREFEVFGKAACVSGPDGDGRLDSRGRTWTDIGLAREQPSHSPSKQKAGAAVYHAVNPHRTSWEKLLPTERRCLDASGEMESVPLEAWLNALRESASKTADVAQNRIRQLRSSIYSSGWPGGVQPSSFGYKGNCWRLADACEFGTSPRWMDRALDEAVGVLSQL